MEYSDSISCLVLSNYKLIIVVTALVFAFLGVVNKRNRKRTWLTGLAIVLIMILTIFTIFFLGIPLCVIPDF